MFETVTLVVLASVDDASLVGNGAGNGGLHGVGAGDDIVVAKIQDSSVRSNGIFAVLAIDDKVRVYGRADPGQPLKVRNFGDLDVLCNVCNVLILVAS